MTQGCVRGSFTLGMKQWFRFLLLLGTLALPIAAMAADMAVLRNGFSIRHQRREAVGDVTRLYLNADSNGFVDVPTSEIDHFEPDVSSSQAMPGTHQELGDVVNQVSSRYHLDPDLVNSVIRAESGFNSRAVSPKGAQGLMQLMPQTASRLGVSNPFDAGDNVEGGTRYLRALLERYHFDLIKALAAYNAGPQKVEQYKGVPPYSETQAYVARVVRDFNRKKLNAQHATAVKTASYHKKSSTHAPAVTAALTPSQR